MEKKHFRKQTAKELAATFQHATGLCPPGKDNTYTCDEKTPIRPVAEYEPMGGVLVAYIGTEAPDAKHKQLPPSGKRIFGVPNELIVRMQQLGSKDGKIRAEKEPVHIFVLCDDEDEKPNIVASLQKTADKEHLHFKPELVHLIPWDPDTYWTRDYCPWWVRYTEPDDEGEAVYAISKHIYTSLGGGSVGLIEGAEEVSPRQGSGIFRCNDDYGAVKISDFLNAPIRKHNNAAWGTNSDEKLPQIKTHRWFFSGLLNVGGNYMVTSKGVIASSYLVATQNELPTDKDPEKPNETDLKDRMEYIMEQANRFLGANTYHVFTDPTGTYIGHIDCWGKFLADDKVIIGESPDEKINEGLNRIAAYFKVKGFNVTRVFAPNIYVANESGEPATTAPYTNSLILNHHVYVPICGDKKCDKDAVDAYQTALGRDYVIEGIIGKPETPWLGTDALHCRTNAIPRTIVDRWLSSQKSVAFGKK
ncbi:MAG: agmatine deiminase family protein [Treponema sp.]|jgi:agmatine deiminase|nr:agmatine deiminase family protein [Treponema sp.]